MQCALCLAANAAAEEKGARGKRRLRVPGVGKPGCLPCAFAQTHYSAHWQANQANNGLACQTTVQTREYCIISTVQIIEDTVIHLMVLLYSN